jgi:hypothetical protein
MRELLTVVLKSRMYQTIITFHFWGAYFHLILCDHTGSGAHPAPYSMGTVGSYSGGKATGEWSWQLTSI